ncbi:glycosyltransferase family 4 protein [Tsukamurella soli]|uniref:glycosyltransferase family 4 protein n=1 Tax=Tsukamurella soli TaxID=644556 RepID=UPI0036180C2C
MATVAALMQADPDPRISIRTVPTYVDADTVTRMRVGVTGMLLSAWLILRGDVDVLHVHLAHGGSVVRKSFPLWAARLRGVPAVIHGHSFDFGGWLTGLPPLAQRVVRAALPADRWLVLGRGLADEYSSALRLPPGDVEVLYNPVALPPAAVGQVADRVQAVALGRLGRRKGSYDIVRAVAALSADVRASLHVTLAGDGEVEQVRAAVRDAGVEDAVTVRDWIGPEERDRVLAASQVFVLPSYDEGLPMALLEAMAVGLVPITSPVGGIPEAVTDGVDGLLVTPGDTTALAAALERVTRDAGARAELAAAARARAADFEISGWYTRLGELWTGLA